MAPARAAHSLQAGPVGAGAGAGTDADALKVGSARANRPRVGSAGAATGAWFTVARQALGRWSASSCRATNSTVSPDTTRAAVRSKPIRGFSLSKRSEEHTSAIQSLLRISYAVFCLQKKIKHTAKHNKHDISS